MTRGSQAVRHPAHIISLFLFRRNLRPSNDPFYHGALVHSVSVEQPVLLLRVNAGLGEPPPCLTARLSSLLARRALPPASSRGRLPWTDAWPWCLLPSVVDPRWLWPWAVVSRAAWHARGQGWLSSCFQALGHTPTPGCLPAELCHPPACHL